MKQLKNLKLAIGCLTSFIFLNSHLALALPSDQDQPFKIAADNVQIDHNTGTTTYQHHVLVDQGSTHLIADHMVTVNNPQNQLTEIIASGKQAIYRTITDSKKPELIAKADTIKYYPLENKIVLLGKANVKQGENVFTGPVIEYNTKLQTVISSAAQYGRTTMIIQPKQPPTLTTG